MDWSQVLRDDGPAVWRTAYRLLGNSNDADDCFQEAVLNALELSRRQSIVNWRALLQRLVAIRAIDRLRQRYRQRESNSQNAVPDQLPSSDPSPSQTLIAQEIQNELRIALTQIPSNQAQAFCLCCLEEWTYRECGLEMSLATEAVGVLVQRARKKLQDILSRTLAHDQPFFAQRRTPVIAKESR